MVTPEHPFPIYISSNLTASYIIYHRVSVIRDTLSVSLSMQQRRREENIRRREEEQRQKEEEQRLRLEAQKRQRQQEEQRKRQGEVERARNGHKKPGRAQQVAVKVRF